MRSLGFFALLLIVFSCSCGEDEVSNNKDLSLAFKLKYDNEPLVMFTDYTYPTGEKLFFSRFSFFISDIQLINDKGRTVTIEEVSYLNLTNSHTTLAGSNTGLVHNITDVPIGNYTKIKFNLGVPPSLNDRNPASFDGEHILSNQAEYWGGWNSYIFTRTEGKIDFNNDGTPESGFALHTGANNAFRSLEFPVNLEVKKDGINSLTVNLDIKKQFGSNPVYDIINNAQIHSLSQQPQVIELINNLTTGISVH